MCAHSEGHGRRRLRLPESNPPGVNHSILTGTLVDDPRPGRNPVGEPITLLRVEFPVADPQRPRMLWTWASCEIEVSDALADRHGIGELEGGAPILVAGQLSERWAISDGRSGRRAAIVAALVHTGASARPWRAADSRGVGRDRPAIRAGRSHSRQPALRQESRFAAPSIGPLPGQDRRTVWATPHRDQPAGAWPSDAATGHDRPGRGRG